MNQYLSAAQSAQMSAAAQFMEATAIRDDELAKAITAL